MNWMNNLLCVWSKRCEECNRLVSQWACLVPEYCDTKCHAWCCSSAKNCRLPATLLAAESGNRREWPGVVFFLNAYKLSTWLFSVWSSWYITFHVRLERHVQKISQWVPFPLLALTSPFLTQVGRKKSNAFWTSSTRKWGKGKESLFLHYFKKSRRWNKYTCTAYSKILQVSFPSEIRLKPQPDFYDFH